uniref:Uncharacterized protein n=1 Tax=Arundo donax TaxID=35708 RepID=A0A0A9HLU8_ARUDO
MACNKPRHEKWPAAPSPSAMTMSITTRSLGDTGATRSCPSPRSPPPVSLLPVPATLPLLLATTSLPGTSS